MVHLAASGDTAVEKGTRNCHRIHPQPRTMLSTTPCACWLCCHASWGAPHHRWAMHRGYATCNRGCWAQNCSAWFQGARAVPQGKRASETKQKVVWGAANEGVKEGRAGVGLVQSSAHAGAAMRRAARLRRRPARQLVEGEQTAAHAIMRDGLLTTASIRPYSTCAWWGRRAGTGVSSAAAAAAARRSWHSKSQARRTASRHVPRVSA